MDTKKLRQKILDLAIRGKLVPQDPNDEPASVLLERIRAEKEQLIKEGKIKRTKKSNASDTSHYENILFDLPQNWEWTTLENICSKIGSGSTPRGGNYSHNGIPFFRSQNVHNNGICYNDIKYINDETHQSMIGTEVHPNDVLLNITGGSLGRCAVVPSSFYIGNVSQHVCILRPILVIPEYLHAFILSEFFNRNMKVSGSGREGLPKYSLEIMAFPLPPLNEQVRIVSQIQSLMSLIDDLNTNKVLLDRSISQCKQVILTLAITGKLTTQLATDIPAIELLKTINPKYTPTDNRHYENVPYEVPESWQWVKLKDLCVFLSRGKSPVYSETDKRYPVFAQKCNLKGGGISLKEARFLEPSTISKWKDVYKLQDGDILINSTGTGTVCRTRLFKSEYLCDYPFVVPDSHVSIIRTYEQISSEYAFLVLSSKFSQDYMMDNLAGSTNQKELYISVLENLLFPLPPFGEQMRIIKCVNKIYTQLEQISSEL